MRRHAAYHDRELDPTEYIATDIGDLLGFASAWSVAEKARRYAGKGGRLSRPDPVPDFDWAAIDDHSFDKGLMLLPAPTFDKNTALEASIVDYDQRRAHKGPMVSGMPDPIMLNTSFERNSLWWGLIVDKCFRVTSIYYPVRNISLQSVSYLIAPTSFATSQAIIEAFPNECRDRLGFSPKIFNSLCSAVGQLILRETAYDFLSLVNTNEEETRLVSQIHADDPRQTSAPEALFSIYARAQLRNTIPTFVRTLASYVEADGHSKSDAKALCREFIERFTRVPPLHYDL